MKVSEERAIKQKRKNPWLAVTVTSWRLHSNAAPEAGDKSIRFGREIRRVVALFRLTRLEVTPLG
jgi:hypothetical protein